MPQRKEGSERSVGAASRNRGAYRPSLAQTAARRSRLCWNSQGAAARGGNRDVHSELAVLQAALGASRRGCSCMARGRASYCLGRSGTCRTRRVFSNALQRKCFARETFYFWSRPATFVFMFIFRYKICANPLTVSRCQRMIYTADWGLLQICGAFACPYICLL